VVDQAARDVCVVGGGPAGLASAIMLRRYGFDVTVLDRAIPPIDKACGEGLMPDSVHALKELGVTLPPEIGFCFRGIRFRDDSFSVEANFPNGTGIAVRRTVLQNLLIGAAERAGVTLQWGTGTVHLCEGGVASDKLALKARWVIGADGLNSQIRRQAGFDGYRVERRRYGFRQHFRIAPWSPYMEVYWGSRCQAYVSPVANDEMCIAVISRDPNLRVAQALAGLPELERRVREARPVSREMGGLSITRKLRRVYRGRLALLGDASGSIDAITGEGMCLCFKQAAALAQSIRRGGLEDYQSEHVRLSRRPHAMAALMLLTMDSHAGLRRRVLASLAKRPHVFESLLAIHVGERSFLDLWPRCVFEFGSAFLAG